MPAATDGPLILTVDQSTSATKAFVFDARARILARADVPHGQSYPAPGWVEQDPEEIWANTQTAIGRALAAAGIGPGDRRDRLRALTITNQRETVLAWDADTGRPVHPAVTWQCGRAAGICRAIENAGHAGLVRERTGLTLSPYFSAAKAAWILENVASARDLVREGRLRIGTMDTWLLWRLTGGRVHATDCSNASRTQLMNFETLRWDPDLLRVFGIPASALPDIRLSDGIFGTVAATGEPLPDRLAGLPITGVLGDSHAALFGQDCRIPGMAKATYGTGSSVMMNTGNRPVRSRGGLVTSVGWGRAGAVEYVLEGNLNSTGATIQWIAEDLGLIGHPRESGAVAASVEDTGGVYLVPAFTGLGAPYWDPDARASITGMSRSTRRAHLVRAAEESIAYQIRDIVDRMSADSGMPLRELRADGGPTRDAFLMQFQADLLGIPVALAGIEELSAFGSCLMGGLAAGVWSGPDEAAACRTAGPEYSPSMDPDRREALYAGWRAAVRRTLTPGHTAPQDL